MSGEASKSYACVGISDKDSQNPPPLGVGSTSSVAIDARVNIKIETNSLEEAYQKVANGEYDLTDATDEEWVGHTPIYVEDESGEHMKEF